MNHLIDVLFNARCKGVRVWLEDDRLQYEIPAGAAVAEEIHALREHKSALISLFRQAGPMEPDMPLPSRDPLEAAPLAPYLEWCYRMYYSHQDSRLAISLRCFGAIDIAALREAVTQLVRRHEALRTTVTCSKGERRQHIGEAPRSVLSTIEISGIPDEQRVSRAQSIVRLLADEPIDPSVGPLFKMVLLKLDDRDHILALSVNWLIWDATSEAILWRDLWALYVQASSGRAASLPEIAKQPADYAIWLRSGHFRWADRQQYWRKRLSGAERMRLFGTSGVPAFQARRLEFRTFHIEQQLKERMVALSHLEHTSLGIVATSAFAVLISQWSGKWDFVFSMHTTARIHADVENAMGRFQCPLFLRIQLQREHTFHDVLRILTEEYSRAYANHDLGQVLTQDFARDVLINPNFNWLPRELRLSPQAAFDRANAGGCVQPLQLEPFLNHIVMPFDIDWDGELEISLTDMRDGLAAGVVHRGDVPLDEVQRFEQCYVEMLRRMTAEPRARISSLQSLRHCSDRLVPDTWFASGTGTTAG